MPDHYSVSLHLRIELQFVGRYGFKALQSSLKRRCYGEDSWRGS